MTQDRYGQNEVRDYLLGNLADQEKMRQIETDLLVNDIFAEELSIAENELIENYLDGDLSQEDKDSFERHFLSTPQGRQQLRFTKNIRRYARNAENETVPAEVKDKVRGFGRRQRYFWIPVVGFAAVLVIGGWLGWNGYKVWQAEQSITNVGNALAQLQTGHRGERPFGPRIVGFDYAAQVNERGAANVKTGRESDIERATGALEKALDDRKTVFTLYGRGKAYLADRQIDNAIALFEEAENMGDPSANLESDLGAAYLQKGIGTKITDSQKAAELLGKSQARLEKAIQLNPELAEPRFNLALCFEALGQSEAAKKAWNEYLEIDPNSDWAGEARRRLAEINRGQTN